MRASPSSRACSRPTPVAHKVDHQKWVLEDPRIIFAIFQRYGSIGINHLGFRIDSNQDLKALHASLESAGGRALSGRRASCYAKSDKYRGTSASGVALESIHTFASVQAFSSAGEETIAQGCCRAAATAGNRSERASCCD